MAFTTTNNRTTETAYTYDTSGNLNTNHQYTTSNSFTYDAENFNITAPSSSYKVDAIGRRVQKTVSGTTTDIFYIGSQIIAEKTGSNWKDYIFFAGQRIAEQTGSSASTATFLHRDHLGSTRLMTDSSGNVSGSCDYEPYGQVQPGSSCSISTSFRYAAMQFNLESDLYHTWYRQYDSRQGRWMGVDAFPGNPFIPQTLNRYAYSWNDPVNHRDPSGLDPAAGDDLPLIEGGCALNCWFGPNSLSAPCVMCGWSWDMIFGYQIMRAIDDFRFTIDSVVNAAMRNPQWSDWNGTQRAQYLFDVFNDRFGSESMALLAVSVFSFDNYGGKADKAFGNFMVRSQSSWLPQRVKGLFANGTNSAARHFFSSASITVFGSASLSWIVGRAVEEYDVVRRMGWEGNQRDMYTNWMGIQLGNHILDNILRIFPHPTILANFTGQWP